MVYGLKLWLTTTLVMAEGLKLWLATTLVVAEGLKLWLANPFMVKPFMYADVREILFVP